MIEPGGSFSVCDDATVQQQERLPTADRDKLYAERTELNAKYSSATLISTPGKLEGGTKLTLDFVLRYHSPQKVLVVDPMIAPEEQIKEARAWLARERPLLLNIAGPRQSYSDQCGFDVCTEGLKIQSDIIK